MSVAEDLVRIENAVTFDGRTTPNEVEFLISRFEGEDHTSNMNAARSLGRIRDEKLALIAAQAMFDCEDKRFKNGPPLAHNDLDLFAAFTNSILGLGSLAEPMVLKELGCKDQHRLRMAISLLSDAFPSFSEHLVRLLYHSDTVISNDASNRIFLIFSDERKVAAFIQSQDLETQIILLSRFLDRHMPPSYDDCHNSEKVRKYLGEFPAVLAVLESTVPVLSRSLRNENDSPSVNYEIVRLCKLLILLDKYPADMPDSMAKLLYDPRFAYLVLHAFVPIFNRTIDYLLKWQEGLSPNDKVKYFGDFFRGGYFEDSVLTKVDLRKLLKLVKSIEHGVSCATPTSDYDRNKIPHFRSQCSWFYLRVFTLHKKDSVSVELGTGFKSPNSTRNGLFRSQRRAVVACG